MYDLIVIGTGPGGYHGAIRAAQLGLSVAAVEGGDVGGVCLNTGCIPTKALLHAAGEIEHARRAADYGLAFGAPAIELDKLAAWRDGIVGKLAGDVAGLLRANNIDLHRGNNDGFEVDRALASDAIRRRHVSRRAIIRRGHSPALTTAFPAVMAAESCAFG